MRPRCVPTSVNTRLKNVRASSTFFLFTDTVMYISRTMEFAPDAFSAIMSLYSRRYLSSPSPFSGIMMRLPSSPASILRMHTVIFVVAVESSALSSSEYSTNSASLSSFEAMA